ncbi:HlyD family efflux transporter periplasmic adaptor subunit [Altererythrobacter sp. ZODW24]|uniref:HlyD family secretion protein n=1 Tax=Altererythrobacter sp. ZODW24 TaxID=2185142 RepID=UPI001F0835FC|nr:HlyD family efflux transporter periplasmic adaptor subunit [Altererythrobacter sp. ZODW24]
MALFRQEALQQRSDRLSGDVAIAVPVAWQTIGYLLFGALVIALIFLSVASYSRVEVATGTITPDKGVAQIVPTRGGIITDISVEEGQQVNAGELLVSISSEEEQQGGESASARIEQAIALQDASLAAQIDMANRASAAQQAQIAAQRSGLQSEISQLESQITLQQTLVASARREYDRAVEIADRGFISERDLQSRQDGYLSRQQELLRLNQTLGSRRSALVEAARASSSVAAQSGSQSALIAADRAAVAQQAASARGARSYALKAPVGGQVSAMIARGGQSVSPGTALMTIVPEGASLRAELLVSSNAIGFIQPGQDVRLAVDAFPYQRFGTVPGKVLTVSRSAVLRPGQNGAPVPVYIVTVEPSVTTITAFGKKQALVPGMALTARIVAEEQSLLEWLFEPLYAVRNR